VGVASAFSLSPLAKRQSPIHLFGSRSALYLNSVLATLKILIYLEISASKGPKLRTHQTPFTQNAISAPLSETHTLTLTRQTLICFNFVNHKKEKML